MAQIFPSISGRFPDQLPRFRIVPRYEPAVPVLLHRSNVDVLAANAQCGHCDTSKGKKDISEVLV